MKPDEIIAAFEFGEIGNVEFFELAMDAGIELEKIEFILAAHMEAQDFTD